MSFDTPNETRGARPRKASWFRKFSNRLAIKRIRAGRSFFGLKVLVLNTIGAKSGEERAVPLGWFDGGEGRWLILAGAARNPGWYYNIVGNPDRVSIEVDGKRVAVVPEQLRGEERELAWQLVTTTSPSYKRLLKSIKREPPIFRLTAKAM